MPGGNAKIRPEDGKQFSKDYQPAEKWTEDKALQLGKELIAWMKETDENVFFKDFLVIQKDLYTTVIDMLSDKFTSFSNLLKQAKEIQEVKLVKFGVFDKLNSTMTKFVLTNNHGWSEKQDVTSNGNELNQLPPQINVYNSAPPMASSESEIE